jgi:hypothetical protein
VRRSLTNTRSRTVAVLLATAGALALLLTGAPGSTPAAHADPSIAVGSSLVAGAGLAPGQALSSPSGSYQLQMQTDGNLVLYGCGGVPCSGALWASGTYGQPGNHLEMQTDGNLVLYSSAGRPVWSTHTWGAGSSFVLQDDTNMVVYTADHRPAWYSGTLSTYGHVAGRRVPDLRSLSGRYALGTPGNTMAVHDTANGYARSWTVFCQPDPRVDCRSSAGQLVLQTDGNLVWYQPGTAGGLVAEWSTGTWGMGPTNWVVMQDDGNFVLYDLDGRALWDSLGYTHR